MKRYGIVLGVALFALVVIGAWLVVGGGLSFVTPNHDGMVRGTVWVANEEGNSITAIDANTNQVLTTLNGIEGPHNLQVAPDGKSVWAVSGHESLAVMIDATAYQVHGTVPTGKEPRTLSLRPMAKPRMRRMVATIQSLRLTWRR